jgi:AcrR family transcriptional regulator
VTEVNARHRTPSLAVEAALVDAAERLLLADGPTALSVRRIAQEAGVAPMGVYNRFGGKHGVIDELFSRGFVELRTLFEAVDGADAHTALVESTRRYRQFALDYPARFAVMFDRVVPEYVPSAPALLEARAAFDSLVALVRRGIDTGVLAPGEPVEFAQQIWSACHGAVSLELRGIGFWADSEAGHRALTETVLRGLSPRAVAGRATGRAPTPAADATRPPARRRGNSGR